MRRGASGDLDRGPAALLRMHHNPYCCRLPFANDCQKQLRARATQYPEEQLNTKIDAKGSEGPM